MLHEKRRSALPLDRFVKMFYQRFKQQRATFLASIQPLSTTTAIVDHEHYASLLLNRLMFLYFMQQKGLLNNDLHYLPNHLHSRQQTSTPDTYYSHFLLPLFDEGLSTPQHSPEFIALFGTIPYLAGNLFALRESERAPLPFQIADAAFEQLFAFFDSYHWSLDASSRQQEQAITPAILGYIFEQYVNQQQTGTYYTREDVTGYIAQYTIIPYLINAVARTCTTLQAEGVRWQLLQAQPDRYIHATIRSENYHPGETTREYSARRAYYAELYSRLAHGQIISADDLITYNLDVCQFIYDDILSISDPVVLRTYYEYLQRITVLDPTCGSGAFLQAALNILAPLHEACLARMQAMSHQDDFRAALVHMQQKPGQRYAILKSIITNNLYGVDIMEDASEICKLCLFLKLMAEVAYVTTVEPLPNIDQHIHAGNILSDLTPTQPADAPTSWYQAFQEIMVQGGFHIIIGNPPYVEYSQKQFPYVLRNFETLTCANLYPCIVERSHHLLASDGRHGMILPLAAFATRNMQPFLESFQRWFPGTWLSFYHFRPSMLFTGGKVASIPTAIYLAKANGAEQRFSTQLLKWPQEERHLLFSRLTYCHITTPRDPENRHYYPKFGHARENALLAKLLQQQKVGSYLSTTPNQNTIFYRSAGGLYWKVFVNFAWPYDTTSNKSCAFLPEYERDVFVAVYNSSLFWWYYTVTFDSFNLKDYMLFGFRFSYPQDEATRLELITQCQRLMADFQLNAQHLKRGTTGSYTIYARKSKAIIDDIDRILARHYGFTPDELDFILNYDLKYRIGAERSE